MLSGEPGACSRPSRYAPRAGQGRARAAASFRAGIKYLRCTTSGAAGNGLGSTIKYLVNQNAGAGSNLAKAHMHKDWARIQMNTPILQQLL
jgi:hypothetical protein